MNVALIEDSGERTSRDEPILKRVSNSGWPLRSVGYQGGDFEVLGAAFEAAVADSVRRGTVGAAQARLLAVDPLIRFAVDWMGTHRP